MNKHILLAGGFLALVTPALAADFPVATQPVVPVVETSMASSPIYAQLLGGAAFGLDATFYLGGDVDATDPTRIGYAAAATAGVVVFDGVSLEVDVMRTFRDEVAAGLDTYGTLSLMANLKYTAAITDTVSVYGAVGAGYIWVDNYDGPPVDAMYNFGGMGYQLIGGASVDFTDNLTGLVEVRFQDSFQDYELGGTATLDLPTVTLLTGLKLSF